jgi:NADPH-dependent 2,4-dienoyl-CoA reductase/sulfur reductase-like enzyme
MFFSTTPRQESLKAIADVKLTPFWLDDARRPEKAPPLTTQIQTDLAIIGGGFTGLWAALQAKQADPSRDIVLLEAGEVAIGASGRNGGFCAASITHGFSNGKSRWGKELAKLITLGNQNLDGIEATVK